MALITGWWALDGLIVLILLILVVYLYATRNFDYWRKRGVQDLSPIPLFGDFKDIVLQRKTPSQWFEELYKLYAPQGFLGLYMLDRPLLLILDVEIIKHILIKDSHNFLDRYSAANPRDAIGDSNLFFTKNPKWKYLRTKLTPVYTSGKLRRMFELMIDVCDDLNHYFESPEFEGEGKIVEVKELTANFATDIIATTAYGIRANSVNNPDGDFRKRGREIFQYSTYRSYEFLAMFFAPHLARLLNVNFFKKENVPFLRDAVWSILEEREKSGFKRNDLIDILIELRNNQTEEEKKICELDGDNLVAQAAIFFTGGFETTSTTMSFALYELAVHPEIQNRVRNEINVALKRSSGKLTYEMVASDLPYLDMVIAETLRFYPPLPFLDRISGQDYKIPGSDLILEKGTPVMIPMMGLHMDENYFPQPRHFNPENFSEENEKARDHGAYMPFGHGPHACIGKRFGLIQTKLGLITILTNHEVLPAEKTPIPIKLNPKAIFTASEGGTHLKIRKLKE